MSWRDTLRSADSQQSTSSRRRVLELGATAVSAAVVPGVVGATPDAGEATSERADRIQRAAIRLREKTGSQQKFEQFLARNADHFQSAQMSFTPESYKTDGPSTQNWSSDAISTSLTLTYYYDSCTSGDPYAYFDLSISVDSSYGSGEGGPDQNSIGWADHHYRYEEGSAYHDSNMDNLSLNKESLNGVDWEWKDGKSCGLGLCGTKDYYVGCKAQLLETDQERGVEASYWDMWEKAEVCGVSFSSSGSVSFSFCTEGKSDQYGYTIEEDSDAYSGCSP